MFWFLNAVSELSAAISITLSNVSRNCPCKLAVNSNPNTMMQSFFILNFQL
jgi:hypothetical protein